MNELDLRFSGRKKNTHTKIALIRVDTFYVFYTFIVFIYREITIILSIINKKIIISNVLGHLYFVIYNLLKLLFHCFYFEMCKYFSRILRLERFTGNTDFG